jgi:hypothetical protein
MRDVALLAVEDIVALADQQRLIRALASGSGRDGFTIDDVGALVDWVVQARITNALINLALEGDVAIRREGDEFTFSIIDDTQYVQEVRA